MEHSVLVGTQNYRESIYNSLQELREREALPFQIEQIQQGKHWLIHCHFETSPLAEEDAGTVQKVHRYYLANVLAETILWQWEEKHVRKILLNKYRFKRSECNLILGKALDYLNNGSGRASRAHRKTQLVTQILINLESAALFDVEGFLQFRAINYKRELDDIISYVVDEYVLQREYIEFIELLKHFVDRQASRLYTLHVIINCQGNFQLYNDLGEKVTNQYLDDHTLDSGNGEFTYEDLLISALIAVAPHQLVLHIRYEGYQDTLQTIRQVFQERVSYCQGCEICDRL